MQENNLWKQLLHPRELSPLLLLAVFGLGFLLAVLATRTISSDRHALASKLGTERTWTKQLERENEALVMRLEAAEQSLTLLREDLSASRKELLALERDNTFYKGLVSPEDLQSGFKLHRFDLAEVGPEASSGEVKVDLASGEKLYRYEAIVAHVGGKGKKLRGSLSLSLSPKQPAFIERLPLEDEGGSISEDSQLIVYKEEITHKLGFRFFQRVSGQIKLQANYEPASMFLQGKSNLTGSSRQSEFEISYQWKDLVAQVVVNTPE